MQFFCTFRKFNQHTQKSKAVFAKLAQRRGEKKHFFAVLYRFDGEKKPPNGVNFVFFEDRQKKKKEP